VLALSALSSGALLASLSEAVVEDVTSFLRRAGLPDYAGSPTAPGFPWLAVGQEEWMLRRAKAWQVRSWAGMVHDAIATFPESGNDGDDVEVRAVKQVADRMAVDFTQTPQQTTSDLRAALGLVDHLPRIFALFEQGRLDWGRARLIATRLLNPPTSVPDFLPGCPQWRLIEAALAGQAPSLARPRLERLITSLLLELAADGAHGAAMAQRRVWVDPLPDGMAFFGAILGADAAQYLMGVLEAMADACRDQAAADGVPDSRTHQQRCADALATLFTVLGEGGDIPIVPTPSNPGGPDPSDAGPARAHPPPDPGADTATGTAMNAAPPATHHSSQPSPSPRSQDLPEPPEQPEPKDCQRRADSPPSPGSESGPADAKADPPSDSGQGGASQSNPATSHSRRHHARPTDPPTHRP